MAAEPVCPCFVVDWFEPRTSAQGSLPAFFGLAVVIPILGHATWHLYRKVVEPDLSDRPRFYEPVARYDLLTMSARAASRC